MKSKRDVKYFQDYVILNFGDELKAYESDNDLPYMLFGSFALLVSDLIKNNQKNKLLIKANSVIEEMASSDDSEVKDLFMVGFLEVFADEISSIEYSRKNLNKPVNDILDIILEYWRHKK